MIYLDATALERLVIEHPESSALDDWLDSRLDEVLTSSLISRVQLLRRCRQTDPAVVPAALALLAELALVPVSLEITEGACSLPPAGLSPDAAIHLASALSLGGDLSAFVTYDEGMGGAAPTLLTTVSPV